MITMYVKEQGAVVRRVSRRLVVSRGGETLRSVRLRELERLVLFGHVELSSAAAVALLEAGIETVLLSLGGRFRGRLAPAEGKNIFLRQAQFRRCEDAEFRLRVSRQLVEAKVRNARTLVQQHNWDHPDPARADAIRRLEACRERIAGAASLDSLRGLEGDAARTYFAALGSMVRAEFVFTARTRRPPRDPVNALLSFGYTLVATELTGAVAAQGLDPHVGVFHDLDYGRPSLALDLLEEFRAPVVDRLALSLVNRGVLQAEHFETRGDGAVLLNDPGRVRLLQFYHQALAAEFQLRGAEERVTFRDLLLRQARSLREALLGEAEYSPFLAR